MQPYQEASKEIQRQGQVPKKVLGTALAIGGSAVGAGLASRIAPFLSRYIPGELMRKGINKVDKRIGSFVNTAIDNGYNLDEIKEFLSSKFPSQSEEESQKETIQHKNPLNDFEVNYPEIAQALVRTMQNGQTPEAAAAILKQSTPFSKSIKKLEQTEGKNFIDYILELFGPTGTQQNQPQQMAQQQQMTQQEQMQGGQRSGGIDQEIMAALDKILKM